MSSSPIATHVSQAPDILSHLSLRIVLNRHVGEFGGQRCDCTRRDGSDFGHRMDGELCEDAGGALLAEAIERLKRFLESYYQ
jgi:hypothetical protein